jgi:hypothetical protein
VKFVERIQSKPTLIVLLRDAFAPDRPLTEDCRVEVKGCRKQPLKTRSGYYIVNDYVKSRYDITVEGPHFMKKTYTGISVADPALPIVELRLEPNPFYSFPPGTTLLRGTVADSGGKLISGATVKISNTTTAAVTDYGGKFVFYFKDRTEAIISGTLSIAREGYRGSRPAFTVPAGTTKKISVTLSPA